MNLSNIKSGGKSTHKKKRLGRGPGSGHGKTCGTGHNGSKSRSGYSIAPGFEGGQMPMYRKLPHRGFSNYEFHKHYSLVNVGDLENIESDEVIDTDLLIASGLVRNDKLPIKILGDGDLTKLVRIKASKCSASAKAKIEANGGEIILG